MIKRIFTTRVLEYFLFLSSEIILSTKSIITEIYVANISPHHFFKYKYPTLVGHFTKDGTPYGINIFKYR